MTALERVQNIAQRLGKVKEARQFSQEAEALQKKCDLLVERRLALTEAVEPAVVLVRNAAMDRQSLPELEKSHQALERVSETFEGTTRTLTGIKNFSILLKNLEIIANSIACETQTAWSELATVPKVSKQILQDTEKIPSQAPAVHQLRLALSELEQRVTNIPSTQAEWDAHARTRQRVKELVEKLITNLPKEVRDFCKAAQGQGAALDMLTPKVRKWLEDHGMFDNLRYRLL